MNKRKYRPFVLSLLFLTNNSETILCSTFTRFNTHHPKLVQAAERHYCCQAGQLPGRAAVRPGSCQARRLPGVCALHHFTKWRTLYCAVESAVLFPVANSRHFLLRHMFVLLNQVLRWPPKLSNRFVYNSDFNAEEGAVLVQ